MSEPSGGSGHEVPVVNNRRVSMEYEVKVGPSGVGGVELYVTRDDGLSWKLTPGEHAAVGELTAGVVKRIVSVDLPEDGSYGFYLVVRSGAGMSQPAPRGGVDAPQMRIKLDTKPPTALLYKPEQDPGQKDALMLKWKASDENLTATPITIQWAERPSGPWNSIGPEQMPNTGSYSWTVPEKGIPFQVYLRLTVRDTAGNMNVAETDQPQLIDLVRPVLNQVRFVPH